MSGRSFATKRGLASRAGKKSKRGSAVSINSKVKLAKLAEYGISRCKDWLKEVADKDPAKAVSLTIGLLEYAVPKLSRTDSVNINTEIELTEEEVNNIKAIIHNDVQQQGVIDCTEADICA